MAHLDVICVLLGTRTAGQQPGASKSYIAVLHSLSPITRCAIHQVSLITACAVHQMIHQMILITACIHAHGAAQLAELRAANGMGPSKTVVSSWHQQDQRSRCGKCKEMTWALNGSQVLVVLHDLPAQKADLQNALIFWLQIFNAARPVLHWSLWHKPVL